MQHSERDRVYKRKKIPVMFIYPFTITGDCNQNLGEFKDCSTAPPVRDDPLNTVPSERCC